MFTNRFFTVLAAVALVTVLVLTVQEAIATSTVTSNEQFAHNMERSREADTARWQAMAEYYQNLRNVQPMERSRAADTARWEAMAEYYQRQAEAQNLQRGRAADAARWTAMAEYYQSEWTLVDPSAGLAIYQRSERSLVNAQAGMAKYYNSERTRVPVRFTKYQLSEWFGK